MRLNFKKLNFVKNYDYNQFKARNRKEYYLEILEPPYPGTKEVATFKIKREVTLQTLRYFHYYQHLKNGKKNVLFFWDRNLLVSYSASVRFRQDHGDDKAEELLDKCLNNIKEILKVHDKASLDQVKIQVENEFFMVLSRKC